MARRGSSSWTPRGYHPSIASYGNQSKGQRSPGFLPSSFINSRSPEPDRTCCEPLPTSKLSAWTCLPSVTTRDATVIWPCPRRLEVASTLQYELPVSILIVVAAYPSEFGVIENLRSPPHST